MLGRHICSKIGLEMQLTFSVTNLIFPRQQTFVDSVKDSSNLGSEGVRQRTDFETYVLTGYIPSNTNGVSEAKGFYLKLHNKNAWILNTDPAFCFTLISCRQSQSDHPPRLYFPTCDVWLDCACEVWLNRFGINAAVTMLQRHSHGDSVMCMLDSFFIHPKVS